MSLFDLLNSLEDVDALITSDQRESETLEYKRAAKRLQPVDHSELAKDVSAFANSGGGVLIYGVATRSDDKTRPEKREAIDAGNVAIIEQVVSTHVRYPIPGIRSKTLPRDGEAELLILDIPSSPLAPHQVAVADYRYYRRQGPHSVPMAHDLIELFFGRRQGAILEPRVEVGKISSTPGNDYAGPFSIVVNVANIGQQVARSTLLRIVFPNDSGTHAFECTADDDSSLPRARILSRGVHGGLLYPGLPTGIARMKCTARSFAVAPGAVFCYLDLYAEEMLARRYSLQIRDADTAAPRGEVAHLGPPPDPMLEYY